MISIHRGTMKIGGTWWRSNRSFLIVRAGCRLFYFIVRAGCRLFYFWGELFPHSVAHISDFPGYLAAGFFSACWREQYCDAYSKSGSSCKANRISDCMVLLSANCPCGSEVEVFN